MLQISSRYHCKAALMKNGTPKCRNNHFQGCDDEWGHITHTSPYMAENMENMNMPEIWGKSQQKRQSLKENGC